MNIIITADYVAGIFENWNDAQTYIETRPSSVIGFTHINDALEYPFYLVQINHDKLIFVAYQEEEDALDNESGSVMFTIENDYSPEPAWSDQMGSLPHDHLVDEEDDMDED